MTPGEIKQFKKDIADPRMCDIYTHTQIPAGACYIDSLNIEFLDGRSCGVESVIEACGVFEKDGAIEKYSFYAQDISVSEFVEKHREFSFLGDGQLRVYDELDDLEINTRLQNENRCADIFKELECLEQLSFVSQDFVYLKMKAVLEHDPLVQQEAQKTGSLKQALDQKIQAASNQNTSNKNISSRLERDGR